MRTAWLTLLAAFLAANVSAATIGFTTSNLGGGTYQYTYSISGFTFTTGESLDISFNPTSLPGLGGPYSSVTSAQAGDSVCTMPNACTTGTNFSLQLFPVNTPPGATGDYFATALVNNPSLTGPFTADFALQNGAQPGAQDFTIYDANFNPIASGVTTPNSSPSSTPEPTTLSLTLAGAFMGLGFLQARRRSASKKA